MTKKTYDIIAWCDRTFYAQARIEAVSPEQALKRARRSIHDAEGEETDGAWEWDRFRVEDADGNNVLEWQEEHVRLRIAARDLLSALQASLPSAENELASLRECHRRDGGLEAEVAACEAVVEQAIAVIRKTTGKEGQP